MITIMNIFEELNTGVNGAPSPLVYLATDIGDSVHGIYLVIFVAFVCNVMYDYLLNCDLVEKFLFLHRTTKSDRL